MKSSSTRLTAIMLLGVTVLFSTSVLAKVEVNLIEPRKFTDIELSGESIKRSIKHLERDINRLFAELSPQYLKQGNNLKIDVTNIDLPGYIDYIYYDARTMRIIKDLDPYRLYFSYELTAEDGSVIKSGEKKIKGFFLKIPRNLSNRRAGNFSYYEEEIKDWLAQDIAGQ